MWYCVGLVPKVIKGGEAPRARTLGAAQRMGRKPIIDRATVGATEAAERIIAEAEARAQDIVAAAEEEAEAARAKGFAEGQDQGRAEATQQIVGALAEVQRMADALEPQFIGLVRACVGEIIGEELRTNDEAIVQIVRRALQDARQQREVIVRVHPEDAEVLRGQERSLLAVLARAQQVDVREDPQIRRGGCIVVTELGSIDASLERQLDALSHALQAELGGGDLDD